MVCISCKTKRHAQFFIWNVIVLMCAISCLAFSTFAIDCTVLQNRLPLTFILMLSNVTFKLAVSKSIPKISYLTYLDKYVLTSLVLMCILCLWHTAVSQLKADPVVAKKADYVAMGVLCFVYIIFNAVFIAKTKYTVRKAAKRRKKKLNAIAAAQTA